MPPLATALFDYSLPEKLIAQVPAQRRDESRLLVINRHTRELTHTVFSQLPNFVRSGDILFRNNAAVLPARLRATRPSGGQVECFLLRPIAGEWTWRCLIRPGKKLPVGATFVGRNEIFLGEIKSKDDDGSAVVHFRVPSGETMTEIARAYGEVPLPPYIQRPGSPDHKNSPQRENDLARYQTVYANPAQRVAVAAPTAGLHFTDELLATLKNQGVSTADVTLHVGLGTFKPVMTEGIEDHPIHHEKYELPVATQRALFPPLPGRRIAVGTTTVRTIEDFLRKNSAPTDASLVGDADIYIYPPRNFRGVDALITNFHQPRSTLLCLVAAFLTPGSVDGVSWLREIYAEAIAREYRFFSYGDAMLIV